MQNSYWQYMYAGRMTPGVKLFIMKMALWKNMSSILLNDRFF